MLYKSILPVVIFASLLSPSLGVTSEIPDHPKVELSVSVHFMSPDGADVLVPLGPYRIAQEGTSHLRLLPNGTGSPIQLAATTSTHEENLTAPVALIVIDEDRSDELHLLLLSPEGHVREAIGSLSGVRSRATFQQLSRVQVSQAYAQIRLPQSASIPQVVPTQTMPSPPPPAIDAATGALRSCVNKTTGAVALLPVTLQNCGPNESFVLWQRMTSAFPATQNIGTTCTPVINEVLPGTMASGTEEFIEIFNPCTVAVDVDGWNLVYRSANNVNPANGADSGLLAMLQGVLPSMGYVLYAGPGFRGPANGALASGIAPNGAVGLRDRTLRLIDSIGYGQLAGNAFVETAAAPVPSAPGPSLSRTAGIDTNNNRVDFTMTSPTPYAP